MLEGMGRAVVWYGLDVGVLCGFSLISGGLLGPLVTGVVGTVSEDFSSAISRDALPHSSPAPGLRAVPLFTSSKTI